MDLTFLRLCSESIFDSLQPCNSGFPQRVHNIRILASKGRSRNRHKIVSRATLQDIATTEHSLTIAAEINIRTGRTYISDTTNGALLANVTDHVVVNEIRIV